MAFKGYRFSLVVGHPVGRRGIGFLEEIVEEQDGESSLDAKSKFDSLEIKKERELRSKFDYWLSAAPPNDKWFHGWPNDHEVKECFCFRWDEKRQHHRLYGYLYHPQPQTDPRFQICVLIYHDVKNDEATNRNLLLKSMSLRNNAMVRTAIELVFPEKTSKGQIQ